MKSSYKNIKTKSKRTIIGAIYNDFYYCKDRLEFKISYISPDLVRLDDGFCVRCYDLITSRVWMEHEL